MMEVAKKGSESHHVDVNMAKTQLSSVKSGSLSHKDYQTTLIDILLFQMGTPETCF